MIRRDRFVWIFCHLVHDFLDTREWMGLDEGRLSSIIRG